MNRKTFLCSLAGLLGLRWNAEPEAPKPQSIHPIKGLGHKCYPVDVHNALDVSTTRFEGSTFWFEIDCGNDPL